MTKSEFIVFFILLCGFKLYTGEKFRQERAQVKYTNPKYIKDPSVFTARRNRHEPYLTNLTGTILTTFDSNATMAVRMQLNSGHDFRLTFTVCEAFKFKWALEFLKTSSDVVPKCPVPPGTYHFFNMELPPKNFPIPLPDGDYVLQFSCFVTETKERIFDASVFLHFEKKRGKN